MLQVKKCPFCAEDIQEAAIKCRHCGSDLVKREVQPPAQGQPVRTASAGAALKGYGTLGVLGGVVLLAGGFGTASLWMLPTGLIAFVVGLIVFVLGRIKDG